MINNGFMQIGAIQGWQCPVCGRVLSPWTQECPCKGQTEGYWSVTTAHTDSITTGKHAIDNISLNVEDINLHIPTIPTFYSETNKED